MREKIKCPLMDEEVDYGICFDISMVAEGEAPETTAPEKATSKDDYKNICLKCPNHRND